jgi:hypothetical protein
MPDRDRVAEQRQRHARRADAALVPASPAEPSPQPSGESGAPGASQATLGRYPAGTHFGYLSFDGEVWDAGLNVKVSGLSYTVLEEKHQSVHELLRLLWRQWCAWQAEHPGSV